MDDDSSYVEMIDRYPGPDPAALYLSDSMMASLPPSRPTASTQAPSMPYVLHSACLNQSFAGQYMSATEQDSELIPSLMFQLLFLPHKITLCFLTRIHWQIDQLWQGRQNQVCEFVKSVAEPLTYLAFIRIWDERQGGAGAFTATGQNRPLSSFAVSPDGWTIAAGAELGVDPQAPVPSEAELDAPIIFWDVRNPTTPKWIHTSTHSDDITQLEFHPILGNGSPGGLLLSSSADGLLTVTSADEPNEDEAVLSFGNWNTSIARVGWTVRREEILANDQMNFKIWAASDMQTLSVWSEEVSLWSEDDFIRIPGTWESDYLINAQWFGYTHTVPWSTNALGLWCGNNKGDIGLISVQDTLSWRLDRVLAGGHTGVVRTCTWDPESQMLITGGEDARLNVWPTSTGDSPVTPHPVVASPVYSQHSNQGYYPPPPSSVEPRPPSVAPSMATVQSPPMSAMSMSRGPDSPVAPGPGGQKRESRNSISRYQPYARK
ncbi:WD40 domain-containing protein [Rhizoctonia solani AG-1 IA]|uniref:WD40 domain-containing protein n=1 Tax=Thanatephorus cucumeris (strain AG1-IA) TaxID=983506 RepID=L8X607_THACA|nr:WD40 domain-containing protein [Rhizoctonia solani AG-1 IA]